jgi:hypothetical protein
MPIERLTAFDMWLYEGLCAAFDAALHDPLPDEMLAVLDTGLDLQSA